MKYSNVNVLVAEMKNLEFNHNHEGDIHRCPLCWEQQCNHNYTIENDPFITLSEEITINELLYA